MEAFWATLKKEVRHIWGPIETFTRSQMRTILFDYIETFYNRSRHQRSLDDRTPAEVCRPRRMIHHNPVSTEAGELHSPTESKV